MTDLFILAAESSGDLHGALLIEELLKLNPSLRIAALAGPKMRNLPIDALFRMEDLQVMGFIDVLAALPRIAKQFFAIRKAILQHNPKGVICIDYPGFHLRLQNSLRKKKYQGKLIHYICPTVWAWGKQRIPLMARNLDLLLTFFPFEKHCFSQTTLLVECIGHPLAAAIRTKSNPDRPPLLALFPGSREKEIEMNLPLQLSVAKRLQQEDPTLEIAISLAAGREEQIRRLAHGARLVAPDRNYELMQNARLALATSGTVTLELALHSTPTIVNYAIRPLDVFLAQKIFRIQLPFYCLVNIIASKEIFPEFFGPHLTEGNFLSAAKSLWFDETSRKLCEKGCREVRELLGEREPCREAASHIHMLLG